MATSFLKVLLIILNYFDIECYQGKVIIIFHFGPFEWILISVKDVLTIALFAIQGYMHPIQRIMMQKSQQLPWKQ